MATITDRNLLVATLARQLSFIDARQLKEVLLPLPDQDTPLEELLLQKRLLTPDTHAMLVTLVDRQLELHGVPEKCLRALGSFDAISEELSEFASPGSQSTYSLAKTADTVDYAGLSSTSPSRPLGPSSGDSRFRILRPHARGGLGKVSMAFDEELRREVALKEIQDRFADEPTSRERFVTEAEITGQLEHPGVVPVYSLGKDSGGRPYYAMRFIRGESLRQASDRFHRASEKVTGPKDPKSATDSTAKDLRSVDFRKLLRRMVDVCQAKEYAHSRGVLHRDLKPDNVMLGKYGETLVVDWGLAKVQGRPEAADNDLGKPEVSASAEASSATMTGVALGTPQFMSPEQASGRWDDLSPATDVYSLGATLFYVLTGKLPILGDNVEQVLENARQGSTVRPRQVSPAVPPPLDAICRKAMSREPHDRYASSQLLSEELERWLADEPVEAYSEPWVIRTRRWVRKHQTLSVSVVASLLVALAGLGIGLAVVTGLNRQLDTSNSNLESANGQLIESNERETKLREKAEGSERRALQRKAEADENFQLAEDAVMKYLAAVSDDFELRQVSLHDLRKRLLLTAIPFYEKFTRKRGEDVELEKYRGHAHFRLAEIQKETGDYKTAIENYRQARTIYLRLRSLHPDRADVRDALARNYNNFGNILWATGRHQDALKEHELAQTLYKELADEFPEDIHYRGALAESFHNAGILHSDSAKWEQAQELLKQAEQIGEKLVAEQPTMAKYHHLLAKSRNSLAAIFYRRRQPRQAATMYEKALSELMGLVKDQPQVTEYRVLLGAVQQNLALVKSELRLPREAKQLFENALVTNQKLVKDFRTVPEYYNNLASTHTNLANVLRQLGDNDAARKHHASAIGTFEKLVEDFPTADSHRMRLGGSYCNFGNLTRKEEGPEKAVPLYAKAILALKPLAGKKGGSATARLFLRNSHWGRALALDDLNKYEEAAQDWDAAEKLERTTLRYQLQANAACSLARVGRHQEVKARAKRLPADRSAGISAYYHFARALSLCAGLKDQPVLADEYGALAVNLLAAAADAKYFTSPGKVSQLQQDADFAAIRKRADFQSLMKKLLPR